MDIVKRKIISQSCFSAVIRDRAKNYHILLHDSKKWELVVGT